MFRHFVLRYRDQETIAALTMMAAAVFWSSFSKKELPLAIPPEKTFRFQIDINTATAAELQALPGIGPKLADEIIRYRQSHPFTEHREIINVKGIGAKKMNGIEPFLLPITP
jgi:competence protein ComEA